MCALIVWRWGLLCQGGLKWERCYNKYKNVGSSQRRKMEASYPADTARGWVEHSAASLQNACDFPFGCCYYLTLECTVNLSVASAAATSINPVSWIEKLLYHLSSSLHCLLFQFRIFFFMKKNVFYFIFENVSTAFTHVQSPRAEKVDAGNYNCLKLAQCRVSTKMIVVHTVCEAGTYRWNGMSE